MSDVSQGEGWWVASDGRWYAPEFHPDQAAVVAAAPAASAAGAPVRPTGAMPVKPERIIPLDPKTPKTARRKLREPEAPAPVEHPDPVLEAVALAKPSGFVDGTQLLGTSIAPPGASRRATTDTLGASSYGGSSVGKDPTKVNNPKGFSIFLVGVIVVVLGVGGFIAHHFLYPPSPHRSAIAVATDVVVQFYNQNQAGVTGDLEPGQSLTAYNGYHPPGASVQIIRTHPDPDGVDIDVFMYVCFNLSGSPCNKTVSGVVPGVIPVREFGKKWYVDETAIVECSPGNLVCYNDQA